MFSLQGGNHHVICLKVHTGNISDLKQEVSPFSKLNTNSMRHAPAALDGSALYAPRRMMRHYIAWFWPGQGADWLSGASINQAAG